MPKAYCLNQNPQQNTIQRINLQMQKLPFLTNIPLQYAIKFLD